MCGCRPEKQHDVHRGKNLKSAFKAQLQSNPMLTCLQILDFGAIRDGVPSNRRGTRILIDGRSSSLGREEIAAAADDDLDI